MKEIFKQIITIFGIFILLSVGILGIFCIVNPGIVGSSSPGQYTEEDINQARQEGYNTALQDKQELEDLIKSLQGQLLDLQDEADKTQSENTDLKKQIQTLQEQLNKAKDDYLNKYQEDYNKGYQDGYNHGLEVGQGTAGSKLNEYITNNNLTIQKKFAEIQLSNNRVSSKLLEGGEELSEFVSIYDYYDNDIAVPSIELILEQNDNIDVLQCTRFTREISTKEERVVQGGNVSYITYDAYNYAFVFQINDNDAFIVMINYNPRHNDNEYTSKNGIKTQCNYFEIVANYTGLESGNLNIYFCSSAVE